MKKGVSLIILFLLALGLQPMVFANSTIDELQDQKEEKNKEIGHIEAEINKYQEEIDKTQEEQKSLKNEIQILQTRANKLKSEIALTNKRIDSANFVMQKLKIEIENKNEQIQNSKKSLAEILRKLDEEESRTLLEILLAHNSLSDFFANIERMEYLQKDIYANLENLKALKDELEQNQTQKDEEKNNLEQLQDNLGDQKQLADINKQQKDNLLRQTQNKESGYKKLLSESLTKQQALEEEIREIEDQIRIKIDPDSLPQTGIGILSWPLNTPVVITQYFGKTPFATQNPQVYAGDEHTGIDLRASVNTPVKSALRGTVTAISNNISICRGYQIGYGKWVLIKHDNNLSTFYSHLSLIKVTPGDIVETGQLIGYSGDTGYTEGPHLHFGVFATQAIDRLEYKSTSQTCGGILMRQPFVAPSGYLNPLSYL